MVRIYGSVFGGGGGEVLLLLHLHLRLRLRLCPRNEQGSGGRWGFHFGS